MNEVSADISKLLKITSRRGDTFNMDINVNNMDGSPYDFTGHTVTLDVFTSAADQSANLSFASGSGLTLSTGQITLLKTVSEMNPLRRGDRLYFLRVTFPDGYKKLWLNGPFVVNEGVYNSTGSNNEATLTIRSGGDVVNISVGGTALDFWNRSGNTELSGHVFVYPGDPDENGVGGFFSLGASADHEIRVREAILEADTLAAIQTTRGTAVTVAKSVAQGFEGSEYVEIQAQNINGGGGGQAGEGVSLIFDLEGGIGASNPPGVIFKDQRQTPKGIEYAAPGYPAGGSGQTLTDRDYVLGSKTYTGSQQFAAVVVFQQAARLASFTVSTLPSASVNARGLIYVSNASGGAVVAFSNGTNWLRVTDMSIIS